MGDSSYRGVSAAQDSRFTNKESIFLRKLKFPSTFDTKVDMTKVELSVLKPWIARRVTDLLGFEDDVVLEYAAGMLQEERFPDPKKIQIQLMGFLESQTADFMAELWELLISAQESPGGVPKRFVEEKKEELRLKREEGERVVREARERARRAADAAGADQPVKRRSRWDAETNTVDVTAPVGMSGTDVEEMINTASTATAAIVTATVIVWDQLETLDGDHEPLEKIRHLRVTLRLVRLRPHHDADDDRHPPPRRGNNANGQGLVLDRSHPTTALLFANASS